MTTDLHKSQNKALKMHSIFNSIRVHCKSEVDYKDTETDVNSSHFLNISKTLEIC